MLPVMNIVKWSLFLNILWLHAYGVNTPTGVAVNCKGPDKAGYYHCSATMTGCDCSNGGSVAFNPPTGCFGGMAFTCVVCTENAKKGCEGSGGQNVCTQKCTSVKPPTVEIF